MLGQNNITWFLLLYKYINETLGDGVRGWVKPLHRCAADVYNTVNNEQNISLIN